VWGPAQIRQRDFDLGIAIYAREDTEVDVKGSDVSLGVPHRQRKQLGNKPPYKDEPFARLS
jgi:hypothetical protein